MTKPTPIHEVLRRIRPLAPIHQRDHLAKLISLEPPRSVRRLELESALLAVMTRQMKRENRKTA